LKKFEKRVKGLFVRCCIHSSPGSKVVHSYNKPSNLLLFFKTISNQNQNQKMMIVETNHHLRKLDPPKKIIDKWPRGLRVRCCRFHFFLTKLVGREFFYVRICQTQQTRWPKESQSRQSTNSTNPSSSALYSRTIPDCCSTATDASFVSRRDDSLVRRRAKGTRRSTSTDKGKVSRSFIVSSRARSFPIRRIFPL
jgi:hypothetical protein